MQEEIFLTDLLRPLFIFCWVWAFFPAIFVGGSQLLADGLSQMEIRAFRLQHYEYGGKLYGSKAWRVAYEVVSLNEQSLRRSVVARWRELAEPDGGMRDLNGTMEAVSAGALLVILPKEFSSINEGEKELFLQLEQLLATLRSENVAVYFTLDSPDSEALLALTQKRQASPSVKKTNTVTTSAWQQLYSGLFGDQYVMTSSQRAGTTPTATPSTPATTKAYNIIAQLNAAEKGRPYIAVVAHYDTYASIPSLGQGADANGSGTAILLELLAVISGLYKQYNVSIIRPKYNLLFLLTTGGKFSYQGARQWIDDFNEKRPGERVALAICLDGLGRETSGENGKPPLYMHVAKAPSEGSSAHEFWQQLNNFAPSQRAVEVVAKKINLSAERLSWEHEVFNVRKIHALTLSHFSNHNDPLRNSLLDTYPANIDMMAMETHARVLANALLAHLYEINPTLCASAKASLEACTLLGDHMANGVQAERLKWWMEMVATKARPLSSAEAMGQLVANLKQSMARYADHWEVQEVTVNDFTLYEPHDVNLTVEVMKPALFELVLGSIIAVYLLLVYLLALDAQRILDFVTRPSKSVKKSA